MPRKSIVNKCNDDGTITLIEMEIPDDQYIAPQISEQERENLRSITRKEFINVLNKTFIQLSEKTDKINDLEIKKKVKKIFL